ncbi:metal ABC transporter solute-binding protein, Zn/Mn family [Actinacidiphila acidipaludis]|uniref:Zinc ABC transporter substrate-binding protein n=1 Tax=Actinacidiphila acidipaludis TaxID=2873382 RepID=A0ABS7Q3X5_9ACTN|nr:zinc ABC transporter substrate-binding protein [Streptomyces acidipaludis]MBY8877546.1 zinc ABC transporter substrate-binding protein [Streptomyces acidipaludis]
MKAAPHRRPARRAAHTPAGRARLALGGAAVLTVLAATACSTASSSGDDRADASSSGSGKGGGRTIQVVAAENFWGSIASQLGGSHVKVTSIIDNPAADPHDYEPTARDARTVAAARYTIVNGVGYDTWADKLLAATPSSGRTDLKVGDLVGVKPGGNPHRWYAPADVHTVVERISADYKKLDPADAAEFDRLRTTFEQRTLGPYDRLTAEIRTTYGGTPVGASESIVSPLADGLGLKMLTPETFLDAISEGTDPTAHDKALIDRQIRDRRIKVYVYNSQNATPDVKRQVDEAEAAGIPVATVTETLTPAGASFQDWQVRQLEGIRQALAKAVGR